jgi:hypothetical protein
MPATKKLTIAALLVATVSIAGCHSGSKQASTAATGAATSAAAAPAASGAAAVSSGAAAGASAPAAAAASTSGGCPLTAAQVTAAMGVTYAAPTVSYGMCSYVSSSTGNAFTIQVLKASGANDFAGTLATAVQDNGTQTTTTIPGVGDKATGVGLEIVVQSGGQIIDIRNADSPGFGNWPKSVALAKLVIAGLH